MIFLSMGMGRTGENNTSRQVTLCILNKAYAVLCNAVAAITVVFSSRGRLQKCANNRSCRQKMVSLLILAIVLVMGKTAAGSSSYWASRCTAGNFTPGSLYSKNLEAVAAILPTRVGSSPLLFASESVGSHGGGEVHALAQCWRLSTRSVCKRCVVAAFRDAKDLCQFREGAMIFRDQCTVGYYNKEMAMFPDDPAIGIAASKLDSTQVVIQSSEYRDAVEKVQEAVRGAAASASTFATGQMEVKTVDIQVTVYAAAQCLPSMAGQYCAICLRKMLDEMQVSTGPNLSPMRVASVWCSYRFALHRFFRGQPTLTLPTAEPPGISGPPASKHDNGRHSVGSWVWVALLGLALGVGATLIAQFLYKKISRRNLQSSESEKRIQLKDRTGEEEAPRVYSGQVESQPSALDSFEEIVQMAKTKEIALFLDYDGTLSPIVRDPERAYMSNEMHEVLQNVANLFRTSIVSGRAREKVFDFVRIKNISYAGSHGTDIKIATSTTEFVSTSEIVAENTYQPAEKYIDMINEVHNVLVNATREIDGAKIEHNKFCVSLHYRNVAEEDLPHIKMVVDKIMENMKDQVKLTTGHMVYEFRPPISWNKGNAVLYMLEKFGDPFPIYVGDDRTDEDVFEVLREKKNGIGILVAETGRETSAFYSVKNPAQVMEFLKMLLNWKETQEQKNR